MEYKVNTYGYFAENDFRFFYRSYSAGIKESAMTE